MTTLIYMPYFDSDNRGVREAQKESVAFFEALEKEYKDSEGVDFLLQKTTGRSEDRLPFLKSIWGLYDIIMIESTKVPTLEMVKELMACTMPICSQDYRTNIYLGKERGIFEFPAHKNVVFFSKARIDIKEGCQITLPGVSTITLEYCTPKDRFCDVSDLGIIKISQVFQSWHPDPEFDAEKLGYDYNTVERLHKWMWAKQASRWHRHKELARRNPLFHYRNTNHETEYLTLAEIKTIFD